MAKTVEQIAKALGISITTVRLVLNGKAGQYRISAKTQSRIASYVGEYGYTINHAARSLKLNKTDTLGLIIPRLSNLFFSTLAEKLEIRCREAGYQLTTSCTYSDTERENTLVETMQQRNVDGLFVVPSSLPAQNHHIKRFTKPLVFLDRDFSDSAVSLVVSDNVNGSAALTHAIIDAGTLPLFFMAGDMQQPTIKQRLQGFTETLAAHGISENADWVLTAQHNRREDGQLLMQRFFELHQDAPPAFIASSLPVLEGALNVLREHYGYIPAEMNIGTFDEHPMLGFLPNNTWSMRQDEDAWVEHAFQAMTQAMEGETAPVKSVIPMTLKHRQRAAFCQQAQGKADPAGQA
ncbi:LacI family DNA-binding transcriptional regulator [Sodalis sp. RH24]|uniref:LacI family DNA-binding transcriptional regulator n=1 Tax=unclassified Sodalis (in: enterobacteria) TaxID=2636512 RepID=UPI0039B40F8E